MLDGAEELAADGWPTRSGMSILTKDEPNSEAVSLSELLRLIPLQSIKGPTEVRLNGVALDSRRVGANYLFVAIRGANSDGHDFVSDAVERGAVAILSEMPAPPNFEFTWVQTPDARSAVGVVAARVYGEPAKKMNLVGITGTNGKTTGAYLLDGVLSELSPPSMMLGTVVRKLGDESVSTRHTTPEAPETQAFLAAAAAKGCRYGVLEVSSHGLALSRLQGTEFAVAVFTNLSRDHLDFHGDMESYFKVKRQLFQQHLRPTGVAVVCIDDPYGERLASELSHSVLTFGFAPTADLRMLELTTDLSGLRLRFRYSDEEHELTSPLLGRYNGLNLLGAVGAGIALGFSISELLSSLTTVVGAPGRFELVDVPTPFGVIVDYAHTDDALRKLLEAARPLTTGKLWVVFGCGGERDRSKRPLMGDVATRLADHVIITSDNPRNEDPLAIIREIEIGARGEAEVEVEPDRRRAIRIALQGASRSDLVVIAGKGHEAYQIVGDQVLEFDDRQMVGQLVREFRELGS